MDGSPPGSAVPGILQERTLEWVAMPSIQAPLEIYSNQIKTLFEISQHYTTRRQLTYSEYSNQVLKIICISLVMLITLFGLSEKKPF